MDVYARTTHLSQVALHLHRVQQRYQANAAAAASGGRSAGGPELVELADLSLAATTAPTATANAAPLPPASPTAPSAKVAPPKVPIEPLVPLVTITPGQPFQPQLCARIQMQTLAALLKASPAPYHAETKWDGERFQIHRLAADGSFRYISRGGHDYTAAFGKCWSVDWFCLGSVHIIISN